MSANGVSAKSLGFWENLIYFNKVLGPKTVDPEEPLRVVDGTRTRRGAFQSDVLKGASV
jgi:hypothetical protein